MTKIKNFLKNYSKHTIIFIILAAAIIRLPTLYYPNSYVFDEVYHAFTAKEYLKGSKEAWEWWTTPPPGVAYEWTHPPLAKELMSASMFILHSQDAWAYRLPGALLGILSIYLVYLVGKKIFENETVGLISAVIFSLDGLNFVQSRTGMNDVYLITFSLISLYSILNKKFFLSSLFLGLALASKWSGLYLGLFLFILLLKGRHFIKIPYFIFIPPLVYLASYLPFFLLGHSPSQFIELQRQIWWYHSHLVATHDYSSPWWSWPLNLYPVWYFVDYHKNGFISNIFASGNPILYWIGCGAILVMFADFIRTRSHRLFVVILGFLVFWLPWAASPRIMFLYHFSPSVPFLSLALGYQLTIYAQNKDTRIITDTVLILILIGFILTLPFLIGMPLPKNIMELFFTTNLTKNPF
jgi:dolichyl-phosphate-mannose-protein mannosyltransferase